MKNMKNIPQWLSSQYHRYLRVWKLMKKPSMQEFKLISKVTAVGLIVIGAIGFLISVSLKMFF
ncbi:MAG: protein translocase SEC61 complex subunit gamma [Candidatus Nanoarchaeia archaeon]